MITLNGKSINITMFPDGTSQVWKLDLGNITLANIQWTFHSEGEFMQLAQLKYLLDSKKIQAILSLPYLPYGRQDKEVNNRATFALHPFADMLNALNFSSVYIIDPHSQEANKLIRNSVAVYPFAELEAAEVATDAEIVCYPDRGALVKYEELYNACPHIFASKSRNQQTGEITGFAVYGNVKDLSVLIVDDICDGGATFVGLAKELYADGAKEVNLFVTHGLFSKGIRPLTDAGIRRIFTREGEAFEVQEKIIYKPLGVI